ncbi:hypothetical protein A2U01_0087691, partial [Trifolium medium]|nr:hypothetical protein [Trifolium medium]
DSQHLVLESYPDTSYDKQDKPHR